MKHVPDQIVVVSGYTLHLFNKDEAKQRADQSTRWCGNLHDYYVPAGCTGYLVRDTKLTGIQNDKRGYVPRFVLETLGQV